MLLGKSSWFGCGLHVPMVMDKIPEESWCICGPKVEKEGMQYPPMAPAGNPCRPECMGCANKGMGLEHSQADPA